MIQKLKPSQYAEEEVAATVGFKLETFKHSKIGFTVFDMSGQGKYRGLWEKYYSDAEAVIFVIDASDDMRFGVAKNELEMLLEHEGKSQSILVN